MTSLPHFVIVNWQSFKKYAAIKIWTAGAVTTSFSLCYLSAGQNLIPVSPFFYAYETLVFTGAFECGG